MRISMIGAAVSLILPFVADRSITAQNPDAVRRELARRVPVTIVQPVTQSGDRKKAIQRARNGGDLIVLPPDATAHELTTSLLALLQMRDQQGDQASQDGSFRVRGPAVAPPLDYHDYQSAKTLAKLAAQPVQKRGDLGYVRVYTIYLPNQAFRDSLRAAGRFGVGRH
jgi:hypothetical protein